MSGDIDAVTAPQFLDAALFAVHAAPQGLVLDLTEVSLLGAAGLEVIVAARRTAKGLPFAVAAADSVTRRPIELTGIHAVVGVYWTLVNALDAVDATPG